VVELPFEDGHGADAEEPDARSGEEAGVGGDAVGLGGEGHGEVEAGVPGVGVGRLVELGESAEEAAEGGGLEARGGGEGEGGALDVAEAGGLAEQALAVVDGDPLAVADGAGDGVAEETPEVEAGGVGDLEGDGTDDERPEPGTVAGFIDSRYDGHRRQDLREEGSATEAQRTQRKLITDFTDFTDEEKKGTGVEARRYPNLDRRVFSSPWDSSSFF
jgi:hypothetical protein